jgi:cobalt-zinc-cadmium efflux system membrane fusion protein
MKRLFYSIIALSIFLNACESKKESGTKTVIPAAVRTDGARIIFPPDSAALGYFLTSEVITENISAAYAAPAAVAVHVAQSEVDSGRKTVLFDDPDMNATYTLFLQDLINIKQAQITLSRVKDLAQHGAATAKDVQEAETNLADEQAAVSEQEAKLKLAGLDPGTLVNPPSGITWLICEIPEAQIAHIRVGLDCKLKFSAYGDELFSGKVDGIGEEVDRVTRMVKARILLPNKSNRIKVGMFATALFSLNEGKSISVPQTALVNVQGKDYVFVKISPSVFERRDVLTGQQIESRIIVLSGLKSGDKVVVKGAMQLKGISFGY